MIFAFFESSLHAVSASATGLSSFSSLSSTAATAANPTRLLLPLASICALPAAPPLAYFSNTTLPSNMTRHAWPFWAML